MPQHVRTCCIHSEIRVIIYKPEAEVILLFVHPEYILNSTCACASMQHTEWRFHELAWPWTCIMSLHGREFPCEIHNEWHLSWQSCGAPQWNVLLACGNYLDQHLVQPLLSLSFHEVVQSLGKPFPSSFNGRSR